MKSRGSHTWRRRSSAIPASFSLAEILVVIAIMAFLMAAIVAVVPRVQNAAKIAKTRAIIKKVDEMLNDRLNGFKRYIATQDRLAGSGSSVIPSYALNSMAEAGNNIPLAKVLGIKKAFRQAFAQSYAELNPSIKPTGSSMDPRTESAACLFLVLTKGPLYDTEPPSASDLQAVDIADTDGDGVPEIIDAWGHPLRYYRWPTRLIRAVDPANPTGTPTASQTINSGPPAAYQIPVNPQWTLTLSSQTSNVTAQVLISSIVPTPAPPSPTWSLTVEQTTALVKDLAKDPDDPLGLIQAAMTRTSPLIIPTTFESTYHTPDTYSVPLIVSMGPDETLGLFEPSDSANHGNLAQPIVTAQTRADLSAVFDNITNHQQ
jgi:type II secretory pathway pseudopilin PulG